MLRNLVRLLLLATLALTTIPTHAASTSDPDSPDDTPSLTRLPVEGAPPAGVVQENPEELHSAGLSGQTEAVDAAAVSFLEAVEQTARTPAPGYTRSHIQGEFLQEQPTDQASRRDFSPEESLHDESRPPENEDSTQPLAPGDLAAEFDGLANTGWIPPDTIMAVGPSHVVEAVNSGFAVYNKSGGQLQGYTTFDSFFSPSLPAGWDGYLFDPRVIYSAEHSRFAMLVLGKDSTSLTSYFFLAFPQTSDPTGTWWIYRFDHQSVPADDSDSWADYCGLGADTWGVYVTCNVFRWVGGFKYAKLWSLDTDGFTGGTINGWVFWDLRWNSNAFAFGLQPALPHTIAGDQATFFVNTFSSSGNSVLLWKLTGDRTNSPTLTRATITTPTYNAIGENVDQPGTSADLDGGDARIMNAVYSSRRVFTVLTDDVDNDGAQAGWLTLKLDVDANSLSWSHLLFSGAGFYYFYPAITMEGAVGGANGNLAIFGSWTDTETSVTASTRFASALFKIYTDQPTSSSGPFLSYHYGLGAYEIRDSVGRNRWGDYSGAGFDWSAGNVWGAAEYAGNGNTWRTRITGREIADGGCTADAFEPDDSSGQASSIGTGGTPQTHNICPVGDEDWVTFTISAESEVVIETSGPAGDTRMWLYDSTLNEVEFNDDGGSGLFSRIDRTCGVDALPPGTYFVRVDEFGDNDEIGTYNLAVTANDCPCNPDLFEPDDSSGQAKVISAGSPQTHSICPVGDEDWVSFSLTAETGVILQTSGPSGDTRMWLYDSGLSQIEFDDDDGGVLFSLIDRTCGVDPLPAGTYFVRVDEFGDNDEIDTYQLAYDVIEECCIEDLVLANDVLTGTQLFEAGSSVTLGPNLVVDGTSIDVRAGNTVIFVNGVTVRGTFSAGTDPGLACP